MSLGAIELDRIDWTRQEPVRCGRVGVEIPVALQSDGDACVGITRNISRAGAFVATRLALRVGERVTLGLAIPGQAMPVVVRAEVRWVSAAPSSGGDPRAAGAGVMFVDPPIGATASIVALLHAHADD